MTIDIRTEKLLSMKEATQYVPKRWGKGVSQTTIWRWGKCGVKGIVLETLSTPGGTFTSVEALQRFYEELAKLDGLPAVNRSTPKPPVTPAGATAILDAAGSGTNK